MRERMQRGLAGRLAQAGVPYSEAIVASWANYPESEPAVQPSVNKKTARDITHAFLTRGFLGGSDASLLHALYGENYDEAMAIAEEIEAGTNFLGRLRNGEQ